MNVALLYLMPQDARKVFIPFAKRWVETYQLFTGGYPHKLYVAYVNANPDRESKKVFEDVEHESMIVFSSGLDIGAQQEAVKRIDCDFLVTGSSRVHFWKEGWLERLVDARSKHIPGLYGGAGASYERGHPHIRCAFYAFNPELLRRYPYKISCRQRALLFESGDWCFSEFAAETGHTAFMVTWDNEYIYTDWRTPPNVFRKGTQENLLVRDKHSDLFDAATLDEKALLTLLADGKQPPRQLAGKHAAVSARGDQLTTV